MSLSGLDDARVKEAYDAAAAEPGGWWASSLASPPSRQDLLTAGLCLFVSRFLLKYTSRDEIEVLGRGNGGIVEIRNAIAQHDETAPLFGFLRYRRRNVLLKYLPDECSRLVQGLSQPSPAACIV